MPNERNYYVICDDKCLFEGMTKEQIIAAIAEATGATPTQIDDAFITKIKEQNANKALKFWVGTTAEYNAIATKSDETFYILTDGDEKEIVMNEFLLAAHPIGSYYWSSDSTNPSTLFGGTWQQIKDKFILAAGDTYEAGDTGGEATHTLTVNELPSHAHERTDFARYYETAVYSEEGSEVVQNAAEEHGTVQHGYITGNAGGGAAHNNMPPYEVAYCWKRTA